MTSMDILAVVASPEQESVFLAAEALAKRWKGRVSVLYLAREAEPITGDPFYTASLWAELVKEARVTAQKEFAAVRARAERIDASVEVRSEPVYISTAEDVAGRHALHADLAIMQTPKADHEERAFEGALFRSGRPVLLLPPDWRGGAIGKHVLVAWKAKREAARALADAAPFLAGSEHTVVATGDAQPEGDGARPGQGVTMHLARKGVKVELRNIDGLGRTAEAALIDEAKTIGADLLVMGGYGHSRLREFVFGGVTRAISRACPIPVLMSH